ncbi:MAG: hypothetical protein HZB61_12740, partial [Nitrospirae bacterium]|nr:hypothetical protein [Nitrospirota bacterium]
WYGGTEYFSTMQGAYDWAEDGDEVQCQYEIIYGDVYIDDLSNKTVTFKGGYDCTYSTTTGVTTIYGNMHISKGKLIINGGKLKVQ